jgi:hypothetical protein
MFIVNVTLWGDKTQRTRVIAPCACDADVVITLLILAGNEFWIGI